MVADANSIDRCMMALIKLTKMVLVVSSKVLKKVLIDLRDTSVHSDSFENLSPRKTTYNASRAFRNRGGTKSNIGAPRKMATVDDIKGLERFVSTINTLVHDLERQNFMLADNLRKARETEFKLRAFVLKKVSLKFVLSPCLNEMEAR